MNINTELSIKFRILTETDAVALSHLFTSSSADYIRYFIPFRFDLDTIKTILSNAKDDRYIGVFNNQLLIGFYMLRGFDQGYETPSFGVFINQTYSGRGLAKQSLEHALTFCRNNKIKKIMLKAHPENKVAVKFYKKAGFVSQGIDPVNNNIILEKKL